MGKKERAIVLGATGNIAFSVAHMVIQLKEYMYKDIDNIIIFFDNWLESDIKIIKSICDKIIFIKYSLDDFLNKINAKTVNLESGGLRHWKHMVYSIYELFNLLDKYHKVLWLDCDIIVRDNFKEIFEFDSVAMRRGIVAKLSSSIGMNIENDEFIYNSGVVLVCDNINYKTLANECYSITKKQFDVIKYPDQTVLTYICNKHNIKVHNLPSDYHYYATARTKDNFYSAKIIHTPAESKPWNNSLFMLMFPEFYKHYTYWTSLGGSKFVNKKEFFFNEVGNSPAHFFAYIKHSIKIISVYNKYSYMFKYNDINININIKDNAIRFILKNNKNIFYKISISNKYHISICNRNPNDSFLLFLKDINNIFKYNSTITSEKTYQYINFSFDYEKDAIYFLNMIIFGTIDILKKYN